MFGINIRNFFIYIQPYMAVLDTVLSFIISLMGLYLIIKTLPRKIKKQPINKEKMILINWSGHPLPDAEWTKNVKVWDPSSPPTFNVRDWTSLELSITKLINDLPKDIKIRLIKGDPNIVIVIPQLAAGLSILLAKIHGITGTFPTITCPLRKEGDTKLFWLPEPIRLSDIRLEARRKKF